MTAPGPTTPDSSQRFAPLDWALFCSIALIWGASFLLIAIGLESLHPGVVTLLRVGSGAVALNLLPGSRAVFDPDDRKRIVALSFVWVGLPFSLFPIAEQHINSAIAGMLNGGMPIFTALFGAMFFGRRTTGPQLVGVAVGFSGVVLISLPSAGDGGSQLWGVLLVVLATMCYGVATNLAYPLQLRYGSRPLMARMLALATLWTLPYGLVGIPASTYEVVPVVAVGVLGVIGTGVAFLIMGNLVGRVGATRASFITYLIPVVSLVLGVTFQDDEVAVLALVGVVLVIAGALLASRAEPLRPPTEAGGRLEVDAGA